MIPREIFRKIRQAKLRPYRPAAKSDTGTSLKSPPESVGIPTRVPNGYHPDFVTFNREVNAIFKTRHPRVADCIGFFLEEFRVLFDSLKQSVQLIVEFAPLAWLPAFVPLQSPKIIQIGGGI